MIFYQSVGISGNYEKIRSWEYVNGPFKEGVRPTLLVYRLYNFTTADGTTNSRESSYFYKLNYLVYLLFWMLSYDESSFVIPVNHKILIIRVPKMHLITVL